MKKKTHLPLGMTHPELNRSIQNAQENMAETIGDFHNQQIFEVRRGVLKALQTLAFDGEAQIVQFSRDNGIMAQRAAELSRAKCKEILDALNLILTGQESEL